MRILVDAANAAVSNSRLAKLREGTRMAMLAWCLDRLGHKVYLRLNPEVRESARREIFRHLLSAGNEEHDVLLASAENVRRRPDCDLLVGYKTTVDVGRDAHSIGVCDVLMAHEYDLNLDGDDRLLPIWFYVFDALVDLFISENELELYMADDLEHFRGKYGEPKRRRVGFSGGFHYGRREMARRLPKWCDVRFNARQSPREYVRYLMECDAGLYFPGDTPKSYRLAELALLGVPVVTVPLETRVEPPMTEQNCVLLRSWDDHETLDDGLSRLDEIRRAADECYRSGWSAMGQAKLLDARLKDLIHASSG